MGRVAPVTDDGRADEMRAWRRRLHWSRHRLLRWKLRVAGETVSLPVRAAAAARAGVRQFGGGVVDAHGVSRLRQWWELYTLQLRYGLEANSYYRFQLFRPERRRRAAQYIDGRQYEGVLRGYLAGLSGESMAIFLNKRAFERWCAEHDIPSARTLLEIAPTDTPDVSAAAALPPADLFSKPADLAGGRGTAVWEHVGGGAYRGADGVERDARALVAELAAQAAALAHPILVQARLRNHPGVAPLTSGGLCTARMVTVRPLGGEPALLIAVQRMPVGASAADNFDAGGLAAAVDVATGRLGVAMRKDAKLLAAPVERHPTTGALVAGHELPCWADAVALVERAHRLVAPTVPIVGWDLAIAEAGPVLVEANNVPGINLMQMPTDVPLGVSPLVSCLVDYLDAYR